jgi:M6 family metalloprotease-like protein
MKKFKVLRPIHLLVILAGCLGHATAAPYGPNGRETQWTQPGGTTLDLRVFGDDYYARTETTTGYTVVRINGDPAYYYATLSADRTQLLSTGVQADRAAPAGLAKHLEISKEAIRGTSSANRAKYDGGRQDRWNKRLASTRKLRAAGGGAPQLNGVQAAEAQIQAAPLLGTKRGLTILVQFPNDPRTAGNDPIDFPTDVAKIERFCNEVGYSDNGNSGSVRDYFYDQSLGKLTYTQSVTAIITLPRPRNYYNFSDYPTNRIPYRNSGDSGNLLLNDALKVLMDDGYDFSDLSLDADNRAIATNIFFAGADSGVWAQGLWPHQFRLYAPVNVGTAANPIFISNYQITNIEDSSPVIGTFCHENGHLILDYPDLYSVIGEGVGRHCLMGSGNHLNDGKTPAPINVYFKDVAGWGNLTDVKPSVFLSASLPTTGNVGYRLRKPNSTTEFFVVENRGTGDKWAEYCNDMGIAIWHIDETVEDGNIMGNPHYAVTLEQADGRSDLEKGANRGDAKDLFDLATPFFGGATTPRSNWWNGQKSGVMVKVVSAVGASTDVQFGGINVNTPDGGEVIFPFSTPTITWEAGITGNVKIDLYKGGVFHMAIATNEANDGKYAWRVPKDISEGEDYQIRISSLTNAVALNDSSDAPFVVSKGTFPERGVIPYGWFKPSSAKKSWAVTKSQVFEGTRSLVSQKIGDGQKSAIAYRDLFRAGTISFYLRVSSERNYDIARFSIDGVPQMLGGKYGISGGGGWTFHSFPVAAGKHTFEWSYEKDDSYAGLSDSAWLDGISLPDTTQEIAIENSDGEDLTSGTSHILFPEVTVESSSKSQVLTIKNVGKSVLRNLKLDMTGQSPTDFVVGKLATTVLAPGASTTIKVAFAPGKAGEKTASLLILSNDVNEGKFAINLQGTALGLPSIAVKQADVVLKDNVGTGKFGYAVINTTGSSKTYTIVNNGSAMLKDLAVSISGMGELDFEISALADPEVAPGKFTTFTVTFMPKSQDKRPAVIHIASNDLKAGSFDINIAGVGAPVIPAVAGSAPSGAGKSGTGTLVLSGSGTVSLLQVLPGGLTPAATTVEVIDGKKYLALTLAKPVTGKVEVSPNLLDWFSGNDHTTVLLDNETTLKVRDNTPITPETKRYIRLK